MCRSNLFGCTRQLQGPFWALDVPLGHVLRPASQVTGWLTCGQCALRRNTVPNAKESRGQNRSSSVSIHNVEKFKCSSPSLTSVCYLPFRVSAGTVLGAFLRSVRDEGRVWTPMNRHLRSKTYWIWRVCHHVFHLPKSHIDTKQHYQPLFQRQNAFCIVYEPGNVKWLWLQRGSCFGLFCFDLSQEQWVCLSFSKHDGPKPLGAGGLSSPRGIPPNHHRLHGRLRMSEFCWVSLKPASAFRALNKLQGHNLLLLSFPSERQREIHLLL